MLEGSCDARKNAWASDLDNAKRRVSTDFDGLERRSLMLRREVMLIELVAMEAVFGSNFLEID